MTSVMTFFLFKKLKHSDSAGHKGGGGIFPCMVKGEKAADEWRHHCGFLDSFLMGAQQAKTKRRAGGGEGGVSGTCQVGEEASCAAPRAYHPTFRKEALLPLSYVLVYRRGIGRQTMRWI